MEKKRIITKKMKLYDRASEIYDKLPKEFATPILNSIIARSLTNGTFVQEASMYFSSDDLEKLMKDLHVPIQKMTRRRISSEKTPKERKEKVSALFEGFQ